MTLERLFLATFALFGFGTNSFPIADNSALIHLRTGRIIADGGGIPRVDPYSVTAGGHPWVVQSWLPEWTYGWLWRLGGLHWVVLEQAVLGALIGWIVALIARAGSPLRTAAAAGLALGVGAPFWTPRPLLVGILAFALLIFTVERLASPLWIIPILWIWVNSHGSFVLGGLWLCAVIVGTALDARSFPEAWTRFGRYALTFALGLGVAMLNPIGPRLLSFPLTLGERRSVFRLVVEWSSPDFQSMPGAFALVFLALSALVLVRTRVAFADAIPVVGFFVMSLIAVRNLPMLSPVLAVALSRALASPKPATEVDAYARSPMLPRALAGVLGAAALMFLLTIWSRPALELDRYPVEAVEHLEKAGLLRRGNLAHQDTTGGYLILRDGGEARVFVDDRVDMYPVGVIRDYVRLLRGSSQALEVLERREIDVVLWHQDEPLAAILASSPDWALVFSEADWKVFLRRT